MPASLTLGAGAFGTSGTFSSILKEFYLGPIQEQLNNEVHVLELFDKMTVDWNGKYCVIPIRTGRNTGVGFRNESGAGGNTANSILPTAGQQGYANLQVEAKYMYGRFEVTGPAMAAAQKGGKNTFISWMDSEMNGLVRDIKNHSNRTFVSGNTTLGFLTETKAATNGNADAFTSWDFVGDMDKVEQLAYVFDAVGDSLAGNVYVGGDTPPSAGANEQLEVDIVRLDTLAVVHARVRVNSTLVGGLPTSVVDRAAGTISLENQDQATNQVTTAGLPVGTACAVIVSQAQTVTNGANWVSDYIDSEPYGIYHNLAFPTLHGVDRTDATGGNNTALQSNFIVQNTGDAFGALTLGTIQEMLDTINNTSDSEPNLLMMSPLKRQAYIVLLQGTVNMSSDSKAKAGDAGFLGLSYANIPIKTSRHVDDGLILFLDTSTWKVLQLEPGAFADLDGSVLSRAAGADSWEGFYKWYYQLACVKPNANGILLGLTLANGGVGA